MIKIYTPYDLIYEFAKHAHTGCPSWTDTLHEHIPADVSFHMRPYSPQSIESSEGYYWNTYYMIYVVYLAKMYTQDVRPGRTPCSTHPRLCKLPNEALPTPIHWYPSKISPNGSSMLLDICLPNKHKQRVRPGRTCYSTNPRLCKLSNEVILTPIHWDLRKILLKYICTWYMIYLMYLPKMNTQCVRPGRTHYSTHPCLCKLPNEVILTLIHWDLSKIWSKYISYDLIYECAKHA